MASKVPPFDKQNGKKKEAPKGSPFGGPNPDTKGKKPNPFAKKGK